MLQSSVLRGHFDGQVIRLNEPLAMEADTEVTIVVLSPHLTESDRELWSLLAQANLERGYGVEEPDYTVALIKEPNPIYEAG